VYPGDIEEAGWKQMLLNSAFCALLRRVNLFVTSHHGRENGCCAELFAYALCNPDAFVISDKEVVHDTQETTAWYRGHAKGLHKILEKPWDTPETRYVFATRTDCCISIEVPPDGRYVLYPKSPVQRNIEPKKPEAPTPTWPSLLLNGSPTSWPPKKST